MEPLSLSWIALGAVFLLAAFAARPLVGFNLWVYKKVGLSRMAEYWERKLTGWILTVRTICTVGGVVFLLLGLGIVGN